MIIIDQETCIGCGLCADDCVFQSITIEDGKAKHNRKCFQCGHCVAICPMNAVSIPDYEMEDVQELDAGGCGFGIDELLYTIKARRSIRRFEDRPVEQEKLEKIIQAGRYTATAVNRQDSRFVIVQKELPELKKIIWKGIDDVLGQPKDTDKGLLALFKFLADKRTNGIDFIFREAPVVLYVAAETPQSSCLAAQNIELAAIAQGLGVLYNGYLSDATNINEEACNWLDLEKKKVQICMLIGYPDVAYKRTAPRREADVRWR